MWKDFFYFSKRERQGIFVLIALIAGIFLGKYLFTPKALPPVEELGLQNKQEEIVPEMNPNETSSYTPYFSPEKKPTGSYRKKEPGPEKRTYYQTPEKVAEPPKANHYPQTEKIKQGTVIDVNRSDTAELIKIPGIGISFARRIVSYRNILGGFYRVEQLQEVYGMYEELYVKIMPYMQINTADIRKIAVLSASVDKLKAHPYINFYQAKAIVELRRKKGKLESVDELSLLEEFTKEDLERIRPYLSFE